MVVIVFIVGLAIGSFANVMIDRTIADESLIYPPSYCESCGSRLRFYELIPVLSYIFQKGKCNHCHKKISLKYPVIELISAIFMTITFYNHDIMGIVNGLIMILLLVMAIIDYKTFDVYMYQVAILMILAVCKGYIYFGYIPFSIIHMVVIFLGIIVFLIKYIAMGDIFVIISLSMGFDDVEYLRFLTIVFGVGGLVGVALLLSGKSRKTKVAFVPIIFLGALIYEVVMR